MKSVLRINRKSQIQQVINLKINLKFILYAPMTKQSNETIIIPAKFISLTLHLLIVTMAYFSYHDNVIAAYPSITTKTDAFYVGGRVSFLACNSLTLIFLLFQIVILFVGTNLFRERVNFINASLHYLGAILWSAYVYQQWQFSQIWAIWAICSFLPLCIQIVTVISVAHK